MTRERTSRPTLSVPSTCARPGGASVLLRFCLSGSCGDSSGAPRASVAATSRTTAPNGPSRARAARRSARQERSTGADARVEPAIEEIHEQVAHDEADRDEEDHALHERVVAGEDRVDHEPAHAGQRE